MSYRTKNYGEWGSGRTSHKPGPSYHPRARATNESIATPPLVVFRGTLVMLLVPAFVGFFPLVWLYNRNPRGLIRWALVVCARLLALRCALRSNTLWIVFHTNRSRELAGLDPLRHDPKFRGMRMRRRGRA